MITVTCKEVNIVELHINPINFKIARLLKNYSMEELSKKSGISRRTISKIERGECHKIQMDTFKKLSDVLDQKSEFFTKDIL